jgi:hypothetical protein
VWTSGGINKLEIYRRLGVGEVWFWKGGRIEIHVLRQTEYEHVNRSELFPDLDLTWLCSFLDRPTALQAVRAMLATLRQ